LRMETPAPTSDAGTMERKNTFNNDPFYVSFLKRVYVLFPILFCAYNTFTQMDSIGTAISTHGPMSSSELYNMNSIFIIGGTTDWYYDSISGFDGTPQTRVCYAYDETSHPPFSVNSYYYNECYDSDLKKYQHIENLSATCPHRHNPIFLGVSAVWAILFAALLVTRVLGTHKYSTADLRFYIAVEKFNDHVANKTCIYLVLSFTMISVIVALAQVVPYVHDGDFKGTIEALFVFMAVNLYSFQLYLKSKFPKLKSIDDGLPEPIPFVLPKDSTSWVNLYGVLMTTDEIFTLLNHEYLKFLIEKNGSFFMENEKIKTALNKLAACETE